MLKSIITVEHEHYEHFNAVLLVDQVIMGQTVHLVAGDVYSRFSTIPDHSQSGSLRRSTI
jgi:hypothetical protein